MPRPILAALAACALAASPSPSHARPNPASTGPLLGAGEAVGDGPVLGAPLRLELGVDRDGRARLQLGYSIRWSAADLPLLPARAARLARDPFGTVERVSRDALTGAGVRLYTLSFRASDLLPVDFLLSPLAFASDRLSSGPRAGPGTRAAGADLAAPARRRRPLLRLDPIYDELERSWRRELRRGLVSTGFDLIFPADGVPYSQKEAVFGSLREAGQVWSDDWSALPAARR